MWNSLTKSRYCQTFPPVMNLLHSLLSSTVLRGVEVLTRDQVSFFPFCLEDEGKQFFSPVSPKKTPLIAGYCGLSKSGQCHFSRCYRRTPCHSLLSSKILRREEVWNTLTKAGNFQTSSPQSRNHYHSLLCSSLVRGEVWKCGVV